MSRRTLLRALDLSRNLHDSRSKLERVILRASRVLTTLRRSMDMDEILLLLKDTSPTPYIHISLSDKFVGGYPLSYMLISDKWIMRVISDANKVLGRQQLYFFSGWSNYPTGFCGEFNVNSKWTHSVWDLDIPWTFEGESKDISIPVQPHTSNQIIRTIEKCHSKVTKEIIVTIIVSIIIHRPVMATSSFYRHFQIESQGRVSAITEHILGGDGIHLHWIDNYARFISRSSMYLNQDLSTMLLDGPRNKGIFALWYFSSQL